jgi:hypothetical protein
MATPYPKNTILVWDRQSDPLQIYLRQILEDMGVSKGMIKECAKAKGRYSALLCFDHIMAAHGNLPCVNIVDDDELRSILRQVLDDCQAQGILHVHLKSVPGSGAAAIVDEVCAENAKLYKAYGQPAANK